MKQLIIFIILFIVIFILSYRSLKHPSSHGFYRFFGWVGTLWICVHNLPFWFYNMFQWNQVISNILITYSLVLVVWGGLFLIKKGKLDNSREEDHLFGFEKTAHLVETGIYRYIRHPLYASLFFLTWGVFFKNISLISFVITLIASLFYILTMITEEKENRTYFGDSYKVYMNKTKMLIPYIV